MAELPRQGTTIAPRAQKVACPTCMALADAPCRDAGGYPLSVTVHWARLRLFDAWERNHA